MKASYLRVVGLGLILFAAGYAVDPAGARPEKLAIVETVTGSGTLGGTAFTDALITVTASGIGTPYNRFAAFPLHKPDWWFNVQAVTVAGVLEDGSVFAVAVTTPHLIAFSNQKSDTGGIGGLDDDLVDLTPADNAFTTYALTSNLTEANVAGPAPFVGYLPNPYATTAGVFQFTSAGSGSFAATVTPVPEPAVWALLTLGLGGTGAALRARRRARAAA